MLSEDGERFLPWMADPVINYEHLHRYRMAQDMAPGLRVLDLASGEGYGSALLAQTARWVLGVDRDADAVAHARRTYAGPRVRFVRGSIAEVPVSAASVDLVVCFEALEHVEEQDLLCAEAARVLAAGGRFLVSTPNRIVYSDEAGFQNPFHVHELDLGEFRSLLGRHFAHVAVLGQHVYPVSSIFPLGEAPSGGREYVAAREAGEERYAFVGPSRKEPRYFLAIASQSPLPPEAAPPSLFLDASEQLFAVQRCAEGAVVELTGHLEVRERQVRELEARGAELQHELGGSIEARRRAEEQAREAGRHLDARAEQARELDALLRQRGLDVQELSRTADALRARIAAMEATRVWRVYRRMRSLLERLGLRRPSDA